MAAATVTQVLMPKLGESVVEGTVARWLKQPGEAVEKLEPLLTISTDKIDTELPAPAAGLLIEIRVPEGQTVAAGTVLALIGPPGATGVVEAAPPSATPTEAETGAPTNGAVQRAPAPAVKVEPTVAAPVAPPVAPAAGLAPGEKPVGRAFVSPVVRRLVAEHHVDLERVPGSGVAGRITRQDVLAYLEQAETSPAIPAPVTSASPVAVPSTAAALGDDELLRPLSAMRRAIAQHMVKSKQTAPHVTTIFEVDMGAVLRHREAHKQAAAERGVSLTVTPYLVAAAAQALRAHPAVNSRYGEQGIIESKRVHVGVAVAVEGGLLVPVVRNADELTLMGLARAVTELAQRARTGALAPDDLTGGTFTITNHGVSGSLIGTPIIAQPQSAILGVGAIVKRPVVVSLDGDASLLPGPDDAIVIRPMAYLSLTFDHRLLDGAAADAFLATLKQALETWSAA